LLRLEDGSNIHSKNWRPQLLVLSKLSDRSFKLQEKGLVSLAGQLKGGKGFTLVSSVLVRDELGQSSVFAGSC
jgi:hypothetical protein